MSGDFFGHLLYYLKLWYSFSNFLRKDDRLRLGFEIRKEVSDYLEHLLGDTIQLKKYDEVAINNYPYLKNIANAIVFVEGYLKQLNFSDEYLKEFGKFIYYNVKLIKNTTPDNTDLNKLFSTINSAGIQLEQSDIVKANLLKCIDNKVLYSKIWETCENMNNFFERNARISFPNSDCQSKSICYLLSALQSYYNIQPLPPHHLDRICKCLSCLAPCWLLALDPFRKSRGNIYL